jgi:hypothetical protein
MRLVIPLQNVVESKGGSVVVEESEAGGVRAIRRGKSIARSARVTEITEHAKVRLVGLTCPVRLRAA